MMNGYLIFCLVSFVLSLVCGLVTIPLIIRYCKAKDLYDMPTARKVHKSAVPRLGGTAFLPGMLVSFLLAMTIYSRSSVGEILAINLWPVYFLASLLIIYITGTVDDLFNLSPRIKFIAQIVAATLLPAAGLYINTLYGFLGIEEIPFWAGAPLTVFVIVFVVNAINLIDGIDGLAAGLSLIALGGFFYCFMREGLSVYCILIAGIMGVLAAYFRFNVFGSTARGDKIFMGDSGSLTLGFIIAVLLVKLSMDNPNVKPFNRESILFSYTLLIVPVFDVCRVVLVRLFNRRPLFGADKNHLHHKLMRAALGPHEALVAILAVELGFIALNVCCYPYCTLTALVAMDVAVWVAADLLLNFVIIRRGQPVFLTPESDER